MKEIRPLQAMCTGMRLRVKKGESTNCDESSCSEALSCTKRKQEDEPTKYRGNKDNEIITPKENVSCEVQYVMAKGR